APGGIGLGVARPNGIERSTLAASGACAAAAPLLPPRGGSGDVGRGQVLLLPCDARNAETRGSIRRGPELRILLHRDGVHPERSLVQVQQEQGGPFPQARQRDIALAIFEGA